MHSAITNPDNFPDILMELCREQPFAVLATAEGSTPYTNLVAVAFTSDLRHLFFATSRATRKRSNLSSNPQVSLLIDNRSNQIADFEQAAAATIIGTAGELTGMEHEEGEDFYLAKHSHLSDFIAEPDCALFQVTIEQIFLVTRFQKVMRFDFSS